MHSTRTATCTERVVHARIVDARGRHPTLQQLIAGMAEHGALVGLQVASVASLLFVSVVGVAIPFFFPAARAELLLSLGNSFAGGVMLGAGFLHMLVDASTDLRDVDFFGTDPAFLPSVLALCGILIPFFLEKVVAAQCEPASPADSETCKAGEVVTHRPRIKRSRSMLGLLHETHELACGDCRPRSSSLSGQYAGQLYGSIESGHVIVRDKNGEKVTNRSRLTRIGDDDGEDVDSDTSSTAGAAVVVTGEVLPPPPPPKHPRKRSGRGSNGSVASVDVTSALNSIFVDPETVRAARFSNLVVLVILSIHSILAGLALGVSGKVNGLTILVALLVHKLFEALVMGVSTVKAHHELRVRLTEIIVYVLATPIGVVIGAILSAGGPLPQHTVGVIVGISSGTFTYIALVEVMAEEATACRAGKFLCYLLGLVGMAILALYV